MSIAIAPIRTRTSHAQRLAVVAILIGITAILVLAEAETRAAEAQLARIFIDAVSPGRAVASGQIVFFGIGTSEVTGLLITTMCSTAVLVIPLLLLAIAVTGFTRASIGRVATGLAISIGLAITCNMIRFALAAWAFSVYGRDGFDVIHRYVGSLFVIAGFIAAFVLLLLISLRDPHRHTPQPVALHPRPPEE